MSKNSWTKEEQKEHRKEWIAALRSGDYNQIFAMTHTFGNNYCAIGLAMYLFDVVESNFSIYSAERICSYYGLTDVRGSYKINGQYRSIMDDNDILKLNFNQIADIIESEPKGLLED